MSSATYASRVAAGRYRHARPSRSLRANPFLASLSSTVITVVCARLWGSPLLTSLTVSAESVRQSTSMMARSRSPSLFTT